MTGYGSEQPGRRLQAAFTIGTAEAIGAVLTPDVAFWSPAFAEPTVGRDTVAVVLATARGIYTDLAFTGLLEDGDRAALFFEADVAGQRLQGCYSVHAGADGAVQRLDALFRPVAATQELVAEMMRRLRPGAAG